MTIGHPDFLEHVAPAPPAFVQALGPFGAGGAWGPVNVPMPSGGSYHIAIFPSDTTRFACTDIVVSHLDSRGIPTFQDFYGGVLCGNGLAGLQGNCNAAVVRGNIYGNTLQISGTLASSAYLNAVIPGHAFTAAGASLNVYATPFALSDPQPKVTAAAADVNSFLQLTPQSQLAVINAAVVNFGTTLGPLPLLIYSGPATIDIEQEGVAAGANMLLTVNGFTVGGGSGNVISPRRYKPLPNGVTQLFPVNLQSLLYVYSVLNSDGAQNATVSMSLAAGKAA